MKEGPDPKKLSLEGIYSGEEQEISKTRGVEEEASEEVKKFLEKVDTDLNRLDELLQKAESRKEASQKDKEVEESQEKAHATDEGPEEEINHIKQEEESVNGSEEQKEQKDSKEQNGGEASSQEQPQEEGIRDIQTTDEDKQKKEVAKSSNEERLTEGKNKMEEGDEKQGGKKAGQEEETSRKGNEQQQEQGSKAAKEEAENIVEKEGSSVEEYLQNIEQNLSEQPQSLQDHFHEMKEDFYKTVEIDEKNFILSNINNRGEVLALVQDEEDPRKWKTRYFRFSGSDQQWKSHPGRKGRRLMKGDEKSDLNHYVQSGKLHKEMYKEINKLPQSQERGDYGKILPDLAANKYVDECEMQEEYKQLQKHSWRKFQEQCQKNYKFYMSGHARLVNKVKTKNEQKQKEQVKKEEQQKVEDIFINTEFPEDMIPEFSEEKRYDAYNKEDLGPERGNDIHIEEYKVGNEEGDELVYAMAYDDKGRVYIDNIYDPRVGMNDYGTLKEVVQMGHLVYKPEDYIRQATCVPEKYKKEVDNKYVDISSLWENLTIVKKFKETLEERGVLNESKLAA